MNPQLQSLLQQAIQAFQDGNFESADSTLKRVLQVDNENLPALHVLGLIKASQSKFKEAVELLKRAERIHPNDASIQYNLAKALVDFGLHKESIPHHKKAVELAPNNPQAWINYGKAASSVGLHENALSYYEEALNLRPDYAEALLNKGATLKELGRYNEAITFSEIALAIDHNLVEALVNKGIALKDLKRYDEAITCYDRALEIKPDYAEAQLNKGVSLHDLRRYDEAITCYDRALEIKPDYAEAQLNKGVSLHDLRRYDEAITCYDRALEIKPDYAEAQLNKGVSLHDLRRYDEAITCYEKALITMPDSVEAWTNKGVALKEIGQIDSAIACYNKALNINPNYHEAIFCKGFTLLLRGDFENGLPMYESRWESDSIGRALGKRFFNEPTWLGVESIEGKAIFIYGEQGLGDFIQFCRYIKNISYLGARVILEVPEQLEGLLQGLEGVSEVVVKGAKLPPFDYCCPLLSLPLACKTGLKTIPSSTSYLASDPVKIAAWTHRLGIKTKKRIGLAWSSTSNFQGDATRSLSFSEFSKAFPPDNFEYICLQKEIKSCDQEAFSAQNNVKFFGGDLEDFSDTAALIECMDLVISTCTSIPHLSAALGRETWILLAKIPDWRWMLEGVDSPWYPTVKLYRQDTLGDWGVVLKNLKEDLGHI